MCYFYFVFHIFCDDKFLEQCSQQIVDCATCKMAIIVLLDALEMYFIGYMRHLVSSPRTTSLIDVLCYRRL